jgi:hypothetical protein
VVLTILTDLNSGRATVEEQKKVWLYELLYFLKLDVEVLEKLPGDYAVELLYKNHIYITDYPGDGSLKVEFRKDIESPVELAGEWAEPEYNMKRDNETGELYYEISVECWSIIDEAIDME